MWAGKYKTTGHGSLIIGDEFGNIIFVSDPAPGCDHDMKKREGEVKEILDLAGSVIADKGFQGSGYVTPAKKPQDRELYTREHEYNSQVSSIRAPIERAVAHLKTWKVLFTDYRRPLNTFLDSFRAAIGLFLRIEFSITLIDDVSRKLKRDIVPVGMDLELWQSTPHRRQKPGQIARDKPIAAGLAARGPLSLRPLASEIAMYGGSCEQESIQEQVIPNLAKTLQAVALTDGIGESGWVQGAGARCC